MFNKKARPLGELLREHLRQQGLETPMLQHRLIDSWSKVVGPTISEYTGDIFIKNQTLFVKINNASLRQDLSLMHTQLTRRLNEATGAQIIADVKVF